MKSPRQKTGPHPDNPALADILERNIETVADMRADLDLQIDLLAEYEVTQVLKLLRGVGEKLGVEECSTQELKDLSRPVVLAEIIKELRTRAESAWGP